MTNKGVAPIDPTTPVGQVRINLGDIASVPLDPAEEGYADYANYGDAELEAFLASAADSVPRATGMAYLQLAATYAVAGRSIKTDDLAINTTSRGSDLLAIAQSWLKEAVVQDTAAAASYTDIVSPYASSDYCAPEGTGYVL